jgi:hypothetical protein
VPCHVAECYFARQARQFHQELSARSSRARLVIAEGQNHVTIIFNLVLPGAEPGREILDFVLHA